MLREMLKERWWLKAVGSVECGAHSPALLLPLLAPQEPSSLGPAAHESEATAGGI